MRPFVVALAASACGDSGGPIDAPSYSFEDYAGAAGTQFEFIVPADSGAADVLLLRIEEDSWELRTGEDWAEAAQVGSWPLSLEDGLSVGETQLLPAKLSEGAQGEGVTVTAMGERTVYYGTFASTVGVEVALGDWAGAQAFAAEVGPIALTYGGTERELAYYQ